MRYLTKMLIIRKMLIAMIIDHMEVITLKMTMEMVMTVTVPVPVIAWKS